MNFSNYMNQPDDCVLFSGEDSPLKILEQQGDEGSSCDGSEISLNGKDDSGITIKQGKAQEKLALYQKSWSRMNKLMSRSSNIGRIHTSLVDNQRNYVSRREDCLASFYAETS